MVDSTEMKPIASTELNSVKAQRVKLNVQECYNFNTLSVCFVAKFLHK